MPGLFPGIFRKAHSQSMSDWHPLENEQQLEDLNTRSYQAKGVAVFKHSSRCPISGMARNRMEKGLVNLPEEMPVYFLDILQFRALSQEIAEQYDVIHESPQLLLIKEGQCVFHTSHQGVSPQALLEHTA